jgi:cytidylate kinase
MVQFYSLRCVIMTVDMGLVTVSGEPGCRVDEAARLAAQRLHFELITEPRMRAMLEEEFGEAASLPDKAYPHMVASIMASLATEHHLVVSAGNAEFMLGKFPNLVRVHLIAPESRRLGMIMLDRRLERPAARALLEELNTARRAERRKKFGRSTAPPSQFDLVLNTEWLDPDQVAGIIESVVAARSLVEQGLLSPAAEAQLQFQVRYQLSRHGIHPPGKTSLKPAMFNHPSEQIFANLLDFYRIVWEYEPHSFAVQWDKDGKILESFTPDFYLPEFDMYVELTTMKQSLVTKKNRKVKLLRQIYPHINIQVFYQKDFQNLIFKYGISERHLSV